MTEILPILIFLGLIAVSALAAWLIVAETCRGDRIAKAIVLFSLALSNLSCLTAGLKWMFP